MLRERISSNPGKTKIFQLGTGGREGFSLLCRYENDQVYRYLSVSLADLELHFIFPLVNFHTAYTTNRIQIPEIRLRFFVNNPKLMIL